MTERRPLSNGVLFVLGLAVLLNYIDRGNLATAAPLLQEELSLSATQMGLLFSSFFWTYAPRSSWQGSSTVSTYESFWPQAWRCGPWPPP